jgi:hypothetical protein
LISLGSSIFRGFRAKNFIQNAAPNITSTDIHVPQTSPLFKENSSTVLSHVPYSTEKYFTICEYPHPPVHSPSSLRQHRTDVHAMSIFSYIRSIYALDTIDTRFTSSSATPYKAVIDGRADNAAANAKRDDSVPGAGVRTDHSGRPIAQPSKWNTPEFYFYYFVFITIVPYMFWVAYDVSRRQYKVPIHLPFF